MTGTRVGMFAAILGLAMAASGCTGSAQHRGEPLPGWPPPAGPRPLSVNLLAAVDGHEQEKMGGGFMPFFDLQGDMSRGVHRALADCPGVLVSEGAVQGWDRRVVVTALTEDNHLGQAVTTGVLFALTLFLSPAVQTMDIRLTARIYDADGRELGTFVQRGDQTEYLSILFLFVLTAWPLERAYEDECYELMRRVLLDARGAGVL